MFTFAAITYNHQAYILEHLESIKYQILTYGQTESFALIISDDASTDGTIHQIKEWLKVNQALFQNVTILTSSVNHGITENYLRAVQSIQTDRFKVMAGDDLYYKNNILNTLREYDLVISPVIKFDSEIITKIDRITLLTMRYSNRETIKKLLECQNVIYAPGVFIKLTMAKDSGLEKFLAGIKYLEDYAKWFFLFHTKPDLSLYYEKTPMVLYRQNSGISTNKQHHGNNALEIEYQRLANDWSLKGVRLPKYINPYRYYLRFLTLKIKYVDAKLNKNLNDKIRTYEKELIGSDQYLTMIKAKAAEYAIKNSR